MSPPGNSSELRATSPRTSSGSRERTREWNRPTIAGKPSAEYTGSRSASALAVEMVGTGRTRSPSSSNTPSSTSTASHLRTSHAVPGATRASDRISSTVRARPSAHASASTRAIVARAMRSASFPAATAGSGSVTWASPARCASSASPAGNRGCSAAARESVTSSASRDTVRSSWAVAASRAPARSPTEVWRAVSCRWSTDPRSGRLLTTSGLPPNGPGSHVNPSAEASTVPTAPLTAIRSGTRSALPPSVRTTSVTVVVPTVPVSNSGVLATSRHGRGDGRRPCSTRSAVWRPAGDVTSSTSATSSRPMRSETTSASGPTASPRSSRVKRARAFRAVRRAEVTALQSHGGCASTDTPEPSNSSTRSAVVSAPSTTNAASISWSNPVTTVKNSPRSASTFHTG